MHPFPAAFFRRSSVFLPLPCSWYLSVQHRAWPACTVTAGGHPASGSRSWPLPGLGVAGSLRLGLAGGLAWGWR